MGRMIDRLGTFFTGPLAPGTPSLKRSVPVQAPDTQYARRGDGIHIAYQVVGDGPVDLLFELPGDNHVFWAADVEPILAEMRGFVTGRRGRWSRRCR